MHATREAALVGGVPVVKEPGVGLYKAGEALLEDGDEISPGGLQTAYSPRAHREIWRV